MEAYDRFAEVYDELMDQTPYDEWYRFLNSKWKEYRIENGLLLDLGCGTGSMTERFASQGYDMIGIDLSMEMLQKANEKKVESNLDILYLCQDMRSFELYGTVKAAYSICDSVNYLLDTEDLEQMLSLVNNYLDPDGIFIFDFNTRYKYENVIGDQVIAENRDDCSFIWENTFDPEDGINEYALTLFIKEDEVYRKYEEEHYQKGYCFEEMKNAVENAGLQFLEAFDADTFQTPHEESERIFFVVREQAVEGKVRQI